MYAFKSCKDLGQYDLVLGKILEDFLGNRDLKIITLLSVLGVKFFGSWLSRGIKWGSKFIKSIKPLPATDG